MAIPLGGATRLSLTDPEQSRAFTRAGLAIAAFGALCIALTIFSTGTTGVGIVGVVCFAGGIALSFATTELYIDRTPLQLVSRIGWSGNSRTSVSSLDGATRVVIQNERRYKRNFSYTVHAVRVQIGEKRAIPVDERRSEEKARTIAAAVAEFLAVPLGDD